MAGHNICILLQPAGCIATMQHAKPRFSFIKQLSGCCKHKLTLARIFSYGQLGQTEVLNEKDPKLRVKEVSESVSMKNPLLAFTK